MMQSGDKGRGKSKKVFAAICLILGAFFIAYCVFAVSALRIEKVQTTPIFPEDRSWIELTVDTISVTPENLQAHSEIFPVLHGPIGSSTATVSTVDELFTLTVEAARPIVISPRPGDLLGRIDVHTELDGATELRNYPFDSYRTRLAASAREPNGQYIPVIISPRQSGTSGFDYLFSNALPSATDQPTDSALTAIISRDVDARFVATMMGAIMVVSAIGVTTITIFIAIGKRGVSNGTLGFIAAFLFALIVLRGVLPGRPPLGIVFDLVAYYWTVLITFLALIGGMVKWLCTEGAD